MSATAQGSPCPSCHALGFIPRYFPGAMVEGSIVICPICDGEKFIASSGPDRALLGICHNCGQEVHVSGVPPCLPEYPAHVIIAESPISTTGASHE